MEKFLSLTAKSGLLRLNNIDTDMIIPKQYLKTIRRSGLGKYLFSDLRYDSQGNKIKDFILNQHPDIKILIAGDNFGCGSSREHAPWALLDFGIRVIIASGFADIFYNNCFKNGILPIKLSKENIQEIINLNSLIMTVDLENQQLLCKKHRVYFKIDSYRKEGLLKGVDDIKRALQHKDKINRFESVYFKKFPWLAP